MGLFNAYKSVMTINKLVVQLEYMINSSADHLRSGNYTARLLLSDINGIEKIIYEIVDIIKASSGARVATYKFRGSLLKIDVILEFGAEMIRILETKMP